MNRLKHINHRHIRAAMQRTPQSANPRRNGSIQIRLRRTHNTNRRRRTILLVIRVERQNQIQRLINLIFRNILPIRLTEHHVQKVAAITQTRVREHIRQTLSSTVRIRRQSTNLTHQIRRRRINRKRRVLINHSLKLTVIAKQRVHHRRQNRHGVRLRRKTVKMMFHALVNIRVLRKQHSKIQTLLNRRQLPIHQQHGRLDKIMRRTQLFNRNTAITQNPILTINIRNITLTNRRVRHARVINQMTRLRIEIRHIKTNFTLGPHNDWQFNTAAIIS